MNLIYTKEIPKKEDLYQLYEGLGWNEFLKLSPDELLKAMKGSWYSVYVYNGSKLIATGRVISDGVTNAYLCGLGVDSGFRNKGIGTEISKMLVKHCLDNNLHIQFFCEEHLVPYYEKMGFRKFAVGMKA